MLTYILLSQFWISRNIASFIIMEKKPNKPKIVIVFDNTITFKLLDSYFYIESSPLLVSSN